MVNVSIAHGRRERRHPLAQNRPVQVCTTVGDRARRDMHAAAHATLLPRGVAFFSSSVNVLKGIHPSPTQIASACLPG